MRRFHIKRGDEVVVIAGDERARKGRGKVIRILPGKQRAIVEGLMMIKRHMRKSRDHPEGRIVEREGSIHLSNLMRADRHEARAAKRAASAAPAGVAATPPAAETPS